MEDIFSDIKFELEGVAGYFRDVIQDHLKWMPKPNLQISIGSILTICATFLINVFHLRRNTLLSSSPRNKKHSLWLIVPLLIVIGGLFGIMWSVHSVHSMKPGRIDKAIQNVKLVVWGAEKEIGNIDLKNWEWEEEATLWLEFTAGIDAGMSEIFDKSLLETIAEQDEALVSVVKDMRAKMTAYRESLKNIDLVYVRCGLGEGLNAENFEVWFEITTSESTKLAKFAKNLENSTTTLSNSLHDIVKNQGKADIGKKILQKRLDIMKSMLSHLREDLTRLEKRKNELYQNELEKLPTIRYSLMIKATVDMACCFLIILATISIISIVCNAGTVSSADRMDDAVDMTTFITVLSCIVIFLCAQGYFGSDTCTLTKSFGFRELTSPFLHENARLDVCPKRESTFFEPLKKVPLPSKPSLNLPIREDKHKMFGLLNKWNDVSRESSRIGEGLQNLKQLYGKLAALEKSNCSHLDQHQLKSITAYLENVKPFVDRNSILKTLAGKVVGKMEPKTRDLSNFIQRSYEKISKSLDRAVDKLTGKILSADASCQPILDGFARIRRVVCIAIENELDNFKWIIFQFLIGCFVAAVVQMSVLRLYSFWFVDFGEDDDSEDEFE